MEQVAVTPNDNLASVFQPDTLISGQYFQNLRIKTRVEPEKNLMLAVLEDAAKCFQDNVAARSGRKKKLFEDAQEWILAEESDWLFSFENICRVLEFNPQYIRQGLLRWKETRRSNLAAAKPTQAREIAHEFVVGN